MKLSLLWYSLELAAEAHQHHGNSTSLCRNVTVILVWTFKCACVYCIHGQECRMKNRVKLQNGISVQWPADVKWVVKSHKSWSEFYLADHSTQFSPQWVFGSALCFQIPAITMWKAQSQSELCVVNGGLKSQKTVFHEWSGFVSVLIVSHHSAMSGEHLHFNKF